jgi:hypothetical protein
MQQARESEKRYKEGKPLSIFDGVPVAIKDELNLKVCANFTNYKSISEFSKFSI